MYSKQYTLEGTYYDRILNLTSFWTPKGSILRSIGGDPTGITNDLKGLLRLEWIEKKDGISEKGQKNTTIQKNRHATNIRPIQ